MTLDSGENLGLEQAAQLAESSAMLYGKYMERAQMTGHMDRAMEWSRDWQTLTDLAMRIRALKS